MTSNMTNNTTAGEQPVPFWIHSTFRHNTKQVKPYGLEWGLDGDSLMTFVPARQGREPPQHDWPSPSCHRGLVEAYNRWAYSKEQEFKTIQDIQDITVHSDGIHVQVEWKIPNFVPYQYCTPDDVESWITDEAQRMDDESSAEVWVNGVYEGRLNGEISSLSAIRLAIQRAQCPGTTLCVKRYSDGGLIRVEKYFRGMLRKRQQVFEHIIDNLIALEDPEILDSKTLIGTATLPDWIMGGNLTSRLHIREMENGDLQFVRPLYNDDIGTSDRKFVLSKSSGDADKIAVVTKELERLRYLATLQHPLARKMKTEKPLPEFSNEEAKTVIFDLNNVPADVVLQDREDRSGSSSIVLLSGGENAKTLSDAGSSDASFSE
jgi:hypothetical protein